MHPRIILFLFLISCLFGNENKDITVRGIENFYNICQGIAYDVKRNSDSEKNLVIWIIDMVPGIEEEIEQIKGEVSYFFDMGIPGLQMSIVTIQENIEFSVPPTGKAEEVIRFLEKRQYKPGINKYRNRLEPLRKIAQQYSAFEGKKYIAYFTLFPWENEDDLELTLAYLKKGSFQFYAISLEAIFSDHYAIVNNMKNESYHFYGQETAADENVWGWLTVPGGYYLNGDSTTTVLPSGFGFYGLSRLASELNGYYYIYDPLVKNKSNSENGNNTSGLNYHSYILKQYKPVWDARVDYTRNIRNSVKEFHFKCWNELSGLKGVVSYESPYKISLQISSNDNRKQTITALTYSFSSHSQIEAAFSDGKKKLELVNAVLNSISRQKSKIKDEKNRDCANLNILYANLTKVQFHLQQYLKTVLGLIKQKNKIKRDFRKNFTIRIKTKVIGNYEKGITSEIKDLTKAEVGAIEKIIANIKEVSLLHKGTPWEYACKSGNCLTFDFSLVPPAPPVEKKEVAKNEKTKKEQEKKKTEPVPPTRAIQSSSSGGGTETSGN